jgi:hypothetical protein
VLQHADFAYAGLQHKPGLYRYGISFNKLPEYMAAGLPVILPCEPCGDPVSASGGGFAESAASPDELAALIARMTLLPASDLLLMGKRGRDFASANYAYDEIARRLKRQVQLAVVAESHLLAALDRVYRGADAMAGLARELTADIANVEDEIGDLLGLSTATTEDAPVVRLLSTMFEQALRTRASDIHIEPDETVLRIRLRVDGVLQEQVMKEKRISSALVLRLKKVVKQQLITLKKLKRFFVARIWFLLQRVKVAEQVQAVHQLLPRLHETLAR